MNVITSFWGLLAQPVDFWGELKATVGNDNAVEQVRVVVEEIRATGVEVPLRSVISAVAHMAGVEARELWNRYVAQVLGKIRETTCAVEFIKWASSAGKVAILSNTPCKCFITAFLEAHGLRVNLVLTSDVMLKRKPLKSVFMYALRRLGAEAHDTVYVGDSEEDLGAMALGMLTIIVGREGGHASFNDLCQARSWLEQIFK